MVSAIGFDDKHRFNTDKIDDVRSDNFLSPEFEAFKATISQMKPKLALGVGHLPA